MLIIAPQSTSQLSHDTIRYSMEGMQWRVIVEGLLWKVKIHNPQSTVMVSLISLCHEISSWLMHGGTRTHTRTTRRKVNTRPARRQTVGQHWRGSTYCFLLLLFFAADIAEGIEARRIGSLRLPHTDYYGSNSIRRSPSVGHLVAPGRHQASSVQATPVSC